MIWEIFPHDKQRYFYGTKFFEVARSGVFVARNGGKRFETFVTFMRFKKPTTENNSNLLNPLNSLNLLNFSLKTKNAYKWNFLPASPLGD
jgi:hypothetical protein